MPPKARPPGRGSRPGSGKAGPSAAQGADSALANECDIPEVLRALPTETGRHLAWGLPPMHKLEDIFQDMAAKALELGFDIVLRHLRGRALRVATMCSGTESPLLGLEMIQRALASRQDVVQRLRISHLFSCEIVPFKQAYIERNFHPPFLFRDILELGGSEARTAYGSLESIPGDPDILVAGTACVDFSALNSKQKALDEGGESGNTFKGMLEYAKRYRPALVIQENVKGAPWDTIAAHWEAIGYMARHLVVDTKSHYIPQTRERGYMVCIDKHRLHKAGLLPDLGHKLSPKRLGDRWADLVMKFRRHASSPAGMFLLSDDDRRLEAIEKAIANRLRFMKMKEVSWDRYEARHQRYRNELEIGNQRPISRSQPGGFICQLPDFYWRVSIESQPERVWETLDINFLKKLQKGWDMNFKEGWIDVSQGVDRSHDAAVFGIVGCLTPCGMPFLTTRGGILSGLEALSLQGLPLDRMLLTRETQRELQDLAGNAMTSTCVSVAILAALIVGYQVLEKGDEVTEVQAEEGENASIQPQDEYDLKQTTLEVSEVLTVDHGSLQDKAARSAMCCTCEKQSGVKDKIFKCVLCGHTACGVCSGNPSHSYEPFPFERSQPWDFIAYLKDLLPMRLILSGLSDQDFDPFKEHLPAIVKEECDWPKLMAIVNSALHDEFLFFDIKRGKDWTVVYEGEHSSLRLIISSTSLQWLLFAKPPSTMPQRSFIREALAKPIARMTPVQGSLIDGKWHVCSLFSVKFGLRVSGAGLQVKSFEAESGLQADEFRDNKVWNRLIVDGAEEDRLRLEVDVRGEYEFLPECGTAQGCLYGKLPTSDCPAVYLFLDPTKLGKPKDDSFVFALEHGRIPGYSSRMTIAELSHTWRSLNAKETPMVVNVYYRPWAKIAHGKLQPRAIERTILRSLHPEVCISIGNQDCHTSYVTLISITTPTLTRNLRATPSPWKILDPTNSTETRKNLAWLVSKVASWTDFKSWTKLGGWRDLPRREDTACRACSPPSPKILWGRDTKGKIVPYEDPKDAGQYERAVKAKPAPFLVFERVDDDGHAELRFSLNIQTLAHQAYAKLIGANRNDGVTFHWRLIPNAYEIVRQATSRFRLADNKVDSPCAQPPHFQRTLRVEQLRSLAWMISQEADEVNPVMEEETEEALLSLMPWRAEVKVAAPKTIRGGVLADEVGYGKTAIILGLIDTQFEKDKQAAREEEGLIPSKATVIVVPPNVYKQWLAEIDKFLGSRYKILGISGTLGLRKKEFHEVRDADIIVVSWTLFNSSAYYGHLQLFTGTPRAPTKGFRNFDHWFQNTLRSLKEVIHILTTQGPDAFLLRVEARRQEVKENETNSTYVPSRRLRGKQLALANERQEKPSGEVTSQAEEDSSDAASEKAELKEMVDDCESANNYQCCADGNSDEEQDDTTLADSNPNTRRTLKRKRGQSTTETMKQLAPDDRETFNIHPSKETQKQAQNWQSLRYPFLHAFSFNRLVIDEYTYSGEERLTALLALQARSKWILSGTPALDDFADIKSIARYFDLHLGVDDDGDLPTQNNRLKSIRRHYTAAENFLMFQPPHTEAWYHHRREMAQRFLDRFARQNSTEIDHIPMETHLVLINQPPAEQAMYQALYERLMDQKGGLMKMRNPSNDPQVSHLNEILGSSQSPLEALLKCCSIFKPQTFLWDVDTCKNQIVTQKKRRGDLWSRFHSLIRQAATVWSRYQMDTGVWMDFVDKTGIFGLGDPDTVPKVLDAIQECFQTYRKWSPRDEYREITTKVDERLHKAANPARRKTQEGNNPENEQPPRKRARPKNSNTDSQVSSKALKGLSTDTASVLKDIAHEERDIRFFEAMLTLQTNANIPTCSNCHTQPESIKSLVVLRSCGHILCAKYTSTISETEQCTVSGCKGSAKTSKIIRGESLNDKSDKDASSESCKISKLIEIINQIPTDELVLVFVQFIDSIDHVSRALKSANIPHRVASPRKAHAITEFTDPARIKDSKSEARVRPKVLILNLGTTMAAGLNLQCANHIIFLLPLLVPTQHEWEAGMTQAIGRARRFGQSRQVHVYHLLVKKTIDVNIMQERHGKILVERRGEPVWVEIEEVSDEGCVPCAGLPFELGM